MEIFARIKEFGVQFEEALPTGPVSMWRVVGALARGRIPERWISDARAICVLQDGAVAQPSLVH